MLHGNLPVCHYDFRVIWQGHALCDFFIIDIHSFIIKSHYLWQLEETQDEVLVLWIQNKEDVLLSVVAKHLTAEEEEIMNKTMKKIMKMMITMFRTNMKMKIMKTMMIMV